MATISEELQELLKDNSKWLEQVKMSLTIAAQLYASFQEVEKDYNENLQKCKDEADKCEQTYNQLETEKTAFSEKLTELTQKATEFNTHIEDLKTQMENLHTDSEKLNTQMQGYIGEAEKFNDKINDFKQYLQDEETKNKNTFDSYNQQMSEQGEKLKTLMDQATALNDSANALKTQIDTAKSEFDTQKADALKALNDNKTQALSEMDTKKTDALNALDTSKTQALSEIDTKKTESLTALNDNKTQALSEFDKKKEEVTQAFNKDAAEKLLTALNDAKTDGINALTQSKNDGVSAINTSKDEAIKAINDTKTESVTALNDNKTQAVAALTQNKTDFINALTQSKTDALAAMDTSKSEAITAIQTEGQALSSRVKVLDKAVTWTVGQGMQYATLEAALKEAGKYVTNTGSSITFRIKDGYTQNQPLNIVNQSVRLFFKSEKDGVKGNINVNINDINRQAFFLQQGSYVVFQDLNLNCGTSVCSQLICSFNSFVETVDCNLNAYAVINVGLSYKSYGIFTRTNFNNTYQDGYWELSVGTGSSASVNDYTKFIANNPKMTAIGCSTAFVNCHFAANSVSAGGITGNYGWGAAVSEGGIIDLIGYDQSLPMTGHITYGRTNIACNQWTREGAIAY